MRKKGKRPIPLWTKKPKRLNEEVAKNNLDMVKSIETKEGKDWVNYVYQKNGLKIKKKGGKK